MHNLIKAALGKTYAFSGWPLANEAEFKHELFHNLAQQSFDGVPLSVAGRDAKTPRLHAEGKVENGNPAKADLLLCDPYVYQTFNYKVDHIIELKVVLNRVTLDTELRKLNNYRGSYDGIWIVSQRPLCVPQQALPSQHPMAGKIRVVGPEGPPQVGAVAHLTGEEIDLESTLAIARDCLCECLSLYGSGKEQYQSYFWCNFEHELERHHSFPCEGDFNAHLYHRLRRALPAGVRIHSEYQPAGLGRCRIDFLLEGPRKQWWIPIEVKMNWDQFKPKYKNRQLVRAEALTILDRFAAVRAERSCVAPILVVIQGEWRRVTSMPNRRDALEHLSRTEFPVELLCFDEVKHEIVSRTLGE